MGKIVLTFDLDNTIFDATPLYREAWEENLRTTYQQDNITFNYTSSVNDKNFKLPTHWDYRKDWPEEPSNKLDKLLTSQRLTQTEIVDTRLIPTIKGLVNHPLFEVYFLTDRAIDLYDDTIKQIWKYFPYMTMDRIVNSYVKKLIVINEISKRKDVSNIIHFDDRPLTFIECVNNKLPCVLISNENTPYNHDLSNWIDCHNIKFTYKTLYDALKHLNDIITNTSTLWSIDTSLFEYD